MTLTVHIKKGHLPEASSTCKGATGRRSNAAFRRALGMKLQITSSIVLAALLAGCTSGGIAPPLIGGPLADAHKTTQHVYWTL
jgi:hypothetical protein